MGKVYYVSLFTKEKTISSSSFSFTEYNIFELYQMKMKISRNYPLDEKKHDYTQLNNHQFLPLCVLIILLFFLFILFIATTIPAVFAQVGTGDRQIDKVINIQGAKFVNKKHQLFTRLKAQEHINPKVATYRVYVKQIDSSHLCTCIKVDNIFL